MRQVRRSFSVRENLRTLNAVKSNHVVNYKDCMIYKDLQKRFFLVLRKILIILQITITN